jgi:hypothetical protein
MIHSLFIILILHCTLLYSVVARLQFSFCALLEFLGTDPTENTCHVLSRMHVYWFVT